MRIVCKGDIVHNDYRDRVFTVVRVEICTDCIILNLINPSGCEKLRYFIDDKTFSCPMLHVVVED